MTDNEIIKALECCSQEDKCQSCPYGAACLDEKYVSFLTKDALDLINRQKAEIERLQKQLQEGIELGDAVLKIAKSEAIKEFAERFKLTFDKAVNGIPRNAKAFSLRGDIIHDTHLIIDHVKDEMVGDNK